MNWTGGGASWIRWVWGLGVCLSLYSLSAESGQAQLHSNRRPRSERIPASDFSSSQLQLHLPAVSKDEATDAEKAPSLAGFQQDQQEAGAGSLATRNDRPVPGQFSPLTPPQPIPEGWQPEVSDTSDTEEAEVFPFPQFPLLKKLDPPAPSLADLGIHLDRLALLPDAELAEQLDIEFNQELARLNTQIANKQERLYQLLQDWASSEADIRQIQTQLSQLRTERDRLALEHLLLLRQLQENFALPLPSPTAASSP